MNKSRCSRSIHGNEFKGELVCGTPFNEIVDGSFVEVRPLESKKEYDSDMFKIENLSESGIELQEMTLSSNDVLGASNFVNGAIDVVNFIGVKKTTKPVEKNTENVNEPAKPNNENQN